MECDAIMNRRTLKCVNSPISLAASARPDMSISFVAHTESTTLQQKTLSNQDYLFSIISNLDC